MSSNFHFDARVENLAYPKDAGPGLDKLWAVLRSREAIAATEAFTDAELPAVAGLSGILLRQFPHQVGQEQFRMTVGWMVRRVMEALGYELCRTDVQINLPGIFSTGAMYRRPGTELRDRSQRITRAHRNAWAEARIES